MRWVSVLVAVSLCALGTNVSAQTETTITYQGRLNDNGQPASGTYNLEFSLWDDPTAGSPVGASVFVLNHPVSDGLVTVDLDFGAEAFDNSVRWLEIWVNGTPLTPRQPVTRTPYSIQTRGLFVDDQHRVGVNTTPSADGQLEVRTDRYSAIDASNSSAQGRVISAHASSMTGLTTGLEVTNDSGQGTGILVRQTSTSAPALGIKVETSGAGATGLFAHQMGAAFGSPAILGVLGDWAGTSWAAGVQGEVGVDRGGLLFGVLGINRSLEAGGAGVRGWHDGSGSGVEGYSAEGNGVYGLGRTGVYGRTSTNGHAGVQGFVGSSGPAYGVYGLGQNSNNYGVFGEHESPFGTAAGVHGVSRSEDAYAVGVHGIIEPSPGNPVGTSAAGVRGEILEGKEGIGVWGSHGGEGNGVQGTTVSGAGVYGKASATQGQAYGVIGQTESSTGFGGFFSGPGYGLFAGATSPGGYAGYFDGDYNYFNGRIGIGVFGPTYSLQLATNSAAKPTSSSWTIASDARLKTDIRTIENPLDRLLALRGVSYRWIHPETQGGMTGVYTGMIAQEVERVFPEWVEEGPDGYKNLTVIGFEGLAVEALRELREEKDAEIESLEARIRTLEALVGELTSGRTEPGG